MAKDSKPSPPQKDEIKENRVDPIVEIKQESLCSAEINHSPQWHDNSSDYTEDLQQILKELSSLRYSSPSPDWKSVSEQDITIDKDYIQLNSIQLLYQFLIWLLSIITAFVSPSEQEQIASSWKTGSQKLQMAGNIFFLYVPKK